jgi:hypothetical protein
LQQAHWQASAHVQEPVSQHLQQAQAFSQEQSAVCAARELGSKNENSIKAVYMERISKLENTCERKSASRSRERNHSRREQ